jgi:hypothetical protein
MSNAVSMLLMLVSMVIAKTRQYRSELHFRHRVSSFQFTAARFVLDPRPAQSILNRI